MLATDQFAVHSPASHWEPLPPRDKDALTTEDIIRFCLRSRRLWAVWLLVSLSIGAAFAVFLPRYYTSYTTILLSAPPAAQAAGAEAADARGYIDSQIQVLRSDEVVGRAVDQMRLIEHEEFRSLEEGLRSQISGYVRMQLAYLLGGEQLSDESNVRHETMVRVKHGLSVSQLGFSNAVEIGFTSKSPELSAAVANAIARSYIDNQRQLWQLVRAEEASNLQTRLAELRDKAFATNELQDSLLADPESAEEARVRFREQQSTTEVYRSLYNALLQRPYMDGNSSSLIHSARVITAAEPPLKHTWPPLFLVMAFATVVGSAGAVGHALVNHATDRSLRTVDDVRKFSRLDRVAALSKIPSRRWKSVGPSEQCLQPVYSMVSAEIHSTLSRVAVRMHGAQNCNGGFVIGLVSPVAGSGGSTMAVHLATVIRETGKKTLLVDANWRKPMEGQPMLNVEPSQKLSGAVATIPADQEGLEVLILRPTAPISELNASLSIFTILQRLQKDYDCVVVDFHSIEQTADLEAAMGVINDVLIVLQARRTSSDHLDALLRIVPREKVAAVLLNRL